jgi:carbon monoxide dehydrogenase subunit G
MSFCAAMTRTVVKAWSPSGCAATVARAGAQRQTAGVSRRAPIEAGPGRCYTGARMQIETSFAVPAPVDRAWTILTDVPRVVPCLPGAQLTEVVDARTFRGTAGVKIGPMQLSFAGEARIEEQDAAARRVRVAARANDTKGRGGAQATMVFVLADDGGATRVDIATDLQLNGAVAQYGRGAGLIKEVANQIVGQFAANLRAQLDQAPPAPAAEPARATATASPAPSAAAALAVGAPAAPVSGLKILFAALRAMLTRWLGRRNTAG